MRQGCPLAPYLFLFFVEAMSSYLHSHVPHIASLQLPLIDNVEQELLDREYANVTTLHTTFLVDSMDDKKLALDFFCIASGACIK